MGELQTFNLAGRETFDPTDPDDRQFIKPSRSGDPPDAHKDRYGVVRSPPQRSLSSPRRSRERNAAVLPTKSLGDAPSLPGLAAIGRIEAIRTAPDGKVTASTRYVALSKQLSPRALLDVVRAHWSVENQLHWTLDVVFDEDDARSRKNHAPENLAILRGLALNIIRTHPEDSPQGRKMKKASWDKDFFFELFAHMR